MEETLQRGQVDCGSSGEFEEVQLPKLPYERVWLALGILGETSR